MIIIVLVLALSVLPVNAQLIRLGNEKIEVVTDKVTGKFAIGSTESGVDLLRGYSSGMPTAHFVVRKDSEYASNEPGLCGSLGLVDSTDIWESSYITTSWSWRELSAWQKIYLLPEDSLKAFAHIELTVYNEALDSHYVGIMYYLDPTLGEEEAQTVLTPYGIVDSIRQFTLPTIPHWWIGYRDSINQPEDIPKYMGAFFGAAMNYPDRIAFGPPNEFSNVVWDWSSHTGEINNLSVLIWWNQIELAPFQIYSVSFYYGGGYPHMSVTEKTNLPEIISLEKCYPNPFNSSINIQLNCTSSLPIDYEVAILNTLGKKVCVLKTGEIKRERIALHWDGRDETGNSVSSGLYIIQLKAGNFLQSKTIIFMK